MFPRPPTTTCMKYNYFVNSTQYGVRHIGKPKFLRNSKPFSKYLIFLWGPKKLPQLARSLGLAKKEFKKTKEEITHTIEGEKKAAK
jgi:hypothetical protein